MKDCVDGLEYHSKLSTSEDGVYKVVTDINRCVFTGDAMAIAGARCTVPPNAILRVSDILNTLPDDTKMFPGNELTKANLEFCHKVDASNPYL